jgi:hypothetical protein
LTTDSHDTIFVAVQPPAAPDTDLIQKAAVIIKKSPQITGLLIAGKTPKIAARFSTLQEAEAAVQNLKSLGLPAIVCLEADLRKPTHCFQANTLEFAQAFISFRNKDNQTFNFEPADAYLIIKGTIDIYEDTEVTKTKMKLNLPATLLTGGIPIRRKITEKTRQTLTKNEAFLRVYSQKTANSSVEIRQHEFNYTCLGDEMALSSSVNINKLLIKIRQSLPKAKFDDRMTRFWGIDVPSATPWEKVDITCNLIYQFERAARVNEKIEADSTQTPDTDMPKRLE